jgi:hypothetical protein
MNLAPHQSLGYARLAGGAERLGDPGADGAATQLTAPVRAASWPLWTALSLFWVYVTLSNVLYAGSMSLSLDPRGTYHYFATWHARVLQHLFLYPVLTLAIWASLRSGWRPAWRAVPLQLALAMGFAALAAPLLYVAIRLIGARDPPGSAALAHASLMERLLFGGVDAPYMVASMTSFLLAYGFALALTTGLALYQRNRDAEVRLATIERAWSGARLTALRMQLSPHTLFNLLHTIRGQIGWDPPAAQSMVVQFADLLRRLLAASERDFCRLRDEIQFVRLYLELQHRRFPDRLQLSLPDSGTLPSVWVPSLILQPLVENAVVHGLAGHTAAVAIRLQVSVAEDALVLQVTNTIGGSPAPARGGIGLRNVRERLALQFGARASLQAGASAAHEWSALIRMPLLYDLHPSASAKAVSH